LETPSRAGKIQTEALPKSDALTDDQLAQIMRHAGVLHRGLRRAFVERVAYELRGQVVGDGVVFRACAKVLRESGMFDPPELGSGHVSKWSR
jgi:hypothetical protein